MAISETKQFAIGIDVGATKIAGALVDRHGNIAAEQRTLTLVTEGSSAVIDRIASVAQKLESMSPTPVAGIGVGTPGYVDPHNGIVSYAVNMNWRNISVGGELAARLENDANVMALGEYYYGAAQGIGNFVYASIGSGLGSGIMADHRLVHGSDFRAAELGHLSLDTQGRLCSCGLRGCVETVVSGPGILTTAIEYLARGQASTLSEITELTPEHVLRAALEQQDALALSVFDYTAEWLGQALAACVALLNPARFVIGGGMGLAAFDLLKPGVSRELERRVIRDSFVNTDIVRSQVHSSAVGASSLVWHAAEEATAE